MPLNSARVATVLVAAVLAAACAHGAPSTASHVTPLSPQLVFAADESSLERAIAEFLVERGVKVQVRGDESDVWLATMWEGTTSLPSFLVIIDTVQSSVLEGEIRERAIMLRLATRYTVPIAETQAVLGRINAHNAGNWAGSWYINPKDRELEASWALNIPREVAAIEAGLVQDALIRIVVSWRELAETLPLSDAGPSRTF